MSDQANNPKPTSFEERLKAAGKAPSPSPKAPAINPPPRPNSFAERLQAKTVSAPASPRISESIVVTPAREPAAASGAPAGNPSQSSFLSKLKSKHVLLASLAVLGAEVGVLAAQIEEQHLQLHGGFWPAILQVAIWSGIISAFLNLGLFTAIDIYHRKPCFQPKKIFMALAIGAACGACAGAIAQTVYSIDPKLADSKFQDFVLRPICWGIMGSLLGLSLAKVIPNLGYRLAAMAGAVGGFVGGVGFLVAVYQIALLPGRMVGFGILAAALALAISLAEAAFREARLEIIWAPNESSFLSLGPQVVYLGGGVEDTMKIRGARSREAGFVLENGRVERIEPLSGKRTGLSNGSRVRVGSLDVVVHCK